MISPPLRLRHLLQPLVIPSDLPMLMPRSTLVDTRQRCADLSRKMDPITHPDFAHTDQDVILFITWRKQELNSSQLMLFFDQDSHLHPRQAHLLPTTQTMKTVIFTRDKL